MSEPKLQSLGKVPVTPLWIIALFVSLVETALIVGVIKTTGWIQGGLTLFVMVFPILVAIGFFAILWRKPFVLYPPSEFGQQDVAGYVKAMQQSSLAVTDLEFAVDAAVRKALVSEETINLLRGLNVSEVKATEILEDIADRAIEEVRENNLVVVKYPPGLLWERGLISGEQRTIPPSQRYIYVSSGMTLGRFLEAVCSTMSPIIRVDTYAKEWVLRNVLTGYLVFLPVYDQEHLDKTSFLTVIGIKPPMEFELVVVRQGK